MPAYAHAKGAASPSYHPYAKGAASPSYHPYAKGAASPSYHPYAKGAARCLVGTMGVAFVGGWLLFPLMLALGHLGAP